MSETSSVPARPSNENSSSSTREKKQNRRPSSYRKYAKQKSYKVQQVVDVDHNDEHEVYGSINISSADGDNDVEEKDTGSEMLFHYLGIFMNFTSYLPMILAFFIPDYKIAVTAAMGVAVFNMGFTYFMYKMERTRSWPKVLDVMFFVVNLIITAVIWTKPDTADFWKYWGGVFIGFFQSFILAVAWSFGYPFTKTYMEDEYGLIGSTFPTIHYATKISTGVWVVTFFIQGIIGIPAGYLQTVGEADQSVFQATTIASYVPFFLAMFICFVALPWYLTKNEEFIDQKFGKDIDAWCAKYPEEKIAIRIREEYGDGDTNENDSNIEQQV